MSNRGKLLFLLLVGAITALQAGHFGVRLANTTGGDNPVTYAYFYTFPERYQTDILATYGYLRVFGSVQNWLPALLLKAFSIAPEIVSYGLLFAQQLLLAYSILCFARHVTGRTDLAWATAFFCLMARPWQWNLANLVSVDTAPYQGQLVLPFLVFAASATLCDRPVRALGLLIVAGIIHPSVTLYMVPIVAGYWWLDRAGRPRKSELVRIAALSAVVVVCVAPALVLQSTVGAKVTLAEHMLAFRSNMHMFPWAFTRWSITLPAFLVQVVLTALALWRIERLAPRVRRLVICAFGASIALGVLHVVGALAQIPSVIQLMPLRSTILFVVFASPLVVQYLMEKLESKQLVVRLSTGGLLLTLAIFNFGVFWGFLLVLILDDVAERGLGFVRPWTPTHRNHLRRASQFVLVGWIGLLAWSLADAAVGSVRDGTLTANNFRIFIDRGLNPVIPGLTSEFALLVPAFATALLLTLAFSAVVCSRTMWAMLGIGLISSAGGLEVSGIGQSGFGRDQVLMMVAGGALLSAAICFQRVQRVLNDALLSRSAALKVSVLLILLAVTRALWMGMRTSDSFLTSHYQAQVWARDNTAEDAMFIVEWRSWRSISHRAAVIPKPTVSFLYSGSRQAKEFDDAFLALHGMDAGFYTAARHERGQMNRLAYSRLDDADVLKIADEFGGDYVVRLVSEPLAFPEIYRNDSLLIYRVQEGN